MTPFRFLLILLAFFLVFMAGLGIYVLNCVSSEDIPSIQQFENPEQYYATQVLSSDGKVLDHFFIERRLSLPYDSIPENFVHALIATEDKDFYGHWGVKVNRIFNAFMKTIFMNKREGASTLTMQLSRSLFLDQRNTLERKIKEAFVAMQIEKTYTKEEIIEMYTNTVFVGRNSYGLMVAAQIYLNKEPKDLTLSECAYLVGLLKGPEIYNGLRDYDKAIKRKNLVLQLMRDQDFITDIDLEKAKKEPIKLARGNFSRRRHIFGAPHFVEIIRNKLKNDNSIIKDYDLYRDGLVIHTTLNARIQQYAEEAAEEHLKKFQKKFTKSFSWKKRDNKNILRAYLDSAIYHHPEYLAASTDTERNIIKKNLSKDKAFVDSVKNVITTVQTGMVVMDPRTGAILAMVGASPKFMEECPDAKYSYNHATQIRRQPGSSFKPFLYATVLAEGMTPSSLVGAGPYSYELSSGNVWSPRGDGGMNPGDSVPLSYALKKSINTCAARLITEVTTPENVVETAKKFGIKNMDAVPSLALGAGGGASPLIMTTAFAALANDGIYVEPYFIERIEDRYGNILYQRNKTVKAIDAISPKVAHEMTGMLQGVVNGGTASNVKKYLKDVDAAGKTGTTNDYADAWFIGYTPQLAAGVWVGFDDRRITFTGGYAYASSAAVPLWARCMAKIYSDSRLPYKQKRFSISFNEDDSLDIIRNDSLLIDDEDDVDDEDTNVSEPETNIENDIDDNNIEAVKPKKDSTKRKLPALPKKEQPVKTDKKPENG